MNNIIFIDTGAYLARFHRLDQFHKKSCETWDWLDNRNLTPITTNHVLDELATLLARRTSYEYSARKMTEIYNSPFLLIEHTSLNDEKEAIRFFEKFADKKVSFTDCLSFVVMKKLKVSQAFTFDRHFSDATFEVIPALY